MNSIVANIRLLICLVTGLGLLSAQSFAQQAKAEPDVGVSRSVVEARLEEVQESADLAGIRQDELVGLYREALRFMDAERSHIEAAKAFAQARANAPAEIDRLRIEIDEGNFDAADVVLDLPPDVDALTLGQGIQREKTARAEANARLTTITQRLDTGFGRPNLVRRRILEASRLADGLVDDLESPVRAGEHPLVTEARRWVLGTHASALRAEIRMLNGELLSQPMRHELLEAQKEETAISLVRSETRVQLLEDLLAAQRQDETARIIAETELAALGEADKNVVIRELADRNRELSAHLAFLEDAIENTKADIIGATESTRRIQQNFRTAQQRLEIAGLNQVLGQVLHEQRRDLPQLGDYRRKAQNRHQAIVESGLRDIQFDAEWAELQNPVAYLDGLLSSIPASEWDTVREPLSGLIAGRRTLMRKTLSENASYIWVLGEQDFAEDQLIRSADEFNEFLAKRLMWVRSAGVVGLDSLRALPQEIADFLASDDWVDAMGALIERLVEAPILWMTLLIAVLLLWQSRSLKNAMRATGRHVGSPSKDSYGATVKAVGLSFLLVLPWPLLLGVTGWEMNRAAYATDGSRAIGTALVTVSTFLMFLLSARALCLDDGIAHAHFRCPGKIVNGVRRELNRLLVTFMIPGFVMVVTYRQHLTSLGGELSRLMFIIMTFALAYFSAKLLNPRTGLLDGLARRRDADARMSVIWLLLGAGIPVALIMAALAGFLYSATTLMDVVIDTLWLVLALIFVREMISRWLVVINQRLIYEVRMSEWEAARAAAQERGGDAEAGEEIPLPADEPMVDVTNLDTDAHKLLNMSMFIAAIIGFGAIWSPIMPALTIFDNVTLWTYREGAVGAETIVPFTLANLFMVLIILLATIFATRSIPSLLEALLRQRGSVGAGSRLAFATLARYGIVLLGIIFIADNIGFQWSQIQWLVAALGVGIGFGLQEIIANFISGLIILLERPIRIGDVVTIGDVSGRVSRLQIRATTITNWDRQELLVPNKEFITGRVLNWTLSDEVVRLVTTVGVSYGSDMPKAMALIGDAAEQNDDVLKSPKPLITFDKFGDDSLDITLRCFIDSPAQRREVRSALNLSINEKLHNAGIVVAFPQRDIHLDSAGPLDIRIRDSEDTHR